MMAILLSQEEVIKTFSDSENTNYDSKALYRGFLFLIGNPNDKS